MNSVSMTDNQQPVQDGSQEQPQAEQAATPVEIRTVNLGDQGQGQVAVVIDWGSTALLLTSDAAAQIALELLSAAYAARAEMAFNTKLAELTELTELAK